MQNPDSSPRFRNGLLLAMAAVALIVMLTAVWWAGSDRSSIAGTYLAAGGTGYLKITGRAFGDQVSGSLMRTPIEGKAYGGKKSLLLEAPISSSGSHETVLIYEFTPSPGKSGDYDLQSVEMVSERPTNPFLAFLDKLRSGYSSPPPLLPSAPPVPTFLHRVDNPLVDEYFRIASSEPELAPKIGHDFVSSSETSNARIALPGPRSAELASIAGRLVTAHPDDLHVRILLLDALIRSQDRKGLEERLSSWRSEYATAAPQNPMLAASFAEAERQARGLALSESGQNGYSHLIRALSPSTGLPVRLKLLSELFPMEDMIPPCPLMGRDFTVMNFLEAQVLAKVGRVEVPLLLLQGEHAEARTLAVSLYRYGQLIEHSDDFLITRLIGIALRSIGASGLEVLALNGSTTTTETETLHQAMNELARFETPTELINFTDGPLPIPYLGMAYTENYDEVRKRHRVANTKFQLVRIANAARHHLLDSGQWPDPARPEILHPLLPDGVPADTFSPTTAPLKLLHEPATDAMVVYSVGPDGRDDGATVDYDPTNGTISAGDVTVRIPRERKHPFPPEGVAQVGSIEEWNSLFPHGLPADPFADTKGRGLSVAQTSSSLLIYSFGPDTDESAIARLTDYGPTVSYDPTNGTVSSGDIFIRIPLGAGQQPE